MSDVQLVSKSSTPPTFNTPQTLMDQLSAWKTALLAAGVFMKLFINNVVVSPNTALSALNESVAPGYTPFSVTTINGPYEDQSGNANMTIPLALFVCSGGGSDLAYGAYLVEVTGAAATVTFTLSSGGYSAPVITSGGSGYLVPPKVTPTGATGSGAVLVAELTGGVVTGINIVSPGTAYTTVTAVIEAPEKLVAAVNFPSPLPLQRNTDAVQVLWEIDNLAA